MAKAVKANHGGGLAGRTLRKCVQLKIIQKEVGQSSVWCGQLHFRIDTVSGHLVKNLPLVAQSTS